MADKDNSDRFEIALGGEETSSIDAVKGDKAEAKRTPHSGTGVDFEGDGTVKRIGASEPDDTEDAEDAPEADANDKEADPEDKQKEAVEEDAPEDLGEWDPENEETAAKFDARYFKEGGAELNMEALGQEVSTNLAKEGGKAELNAATYGWLKDRMGVPKDYVDRIIAGEVAMQERNAEEVYKVVGGKDLYVTKITWANGAYSAEQKERFNAALKAGGEQAQEALELLNMRWDKAGNKLPGVKREERSEHRRIGLPKRPASPAKTTSTSETPSGRGGVQPYANAEEHRAHLKEAQRSGDKNQLALVKKRLEASTFWR